MNRLHPFSSSRPTRGVIAPLPVQSGRMPPAPPLATPPALLDVLPVAIAKAFAMTLANAFPSTFPPPTARPFSLVSAAATVSANSTTADFLDLTGILGTGSGQIPGGHRAIISTFGVNSTSTSLTWTFTVNSAPRQPVVGFVGQYGTIAAPSFLPGPGVALRAGDLFAVSVQNTSGADVVAVIARIDGFFWDISAS